MISDSISHFAKRTSQPNYCAVIYFFYGIGVHIITNLCDNMIFGLQFGRGKFFEFIAILALSTIRCIFGYKIKIISFVKALWFSINLPTVFRIYCVTRPMPLLAVRCRAMLSLSGRLLLFLISLIALNIRSSAVFTSIPDAFSVGDLQ